MPTYEYECRSCHHRFERSQSITARPAAACPKCKKGSKRLISIGGGALFKGSGFYTTDYRSSGYKKAAAAAAAEKSPPKADKSCSGEPKSCSGPCSTPKPGKPKSS